MSAPRTIVAHLSDTHIVSEGASYFGCDTARFLSDAIDALHALPVPPDCVVVTGDLANSGRPAQYARFREVMSRLRVPYFVIPGNHDEPGALRAHLAPQTYGGSRDGLLRYVIDDFAVRIVGLDANDTRGWPGAGLRRATLAWLRDVVQAPPARPTIVCVHQPPFRTGIHYFDVLGFRGARRLRALVERNPHVQRVVSGHIHCVRSAAWNGSLAFTAPSTAPQVVPLLFMDGAVAGLRHEAPGFALHSWEADAGVTTTVYRRGAAGSYERSPLP